MIYVTHNLAEGVTLADWVLMIQQGHWSLRAFLKRHSDPPMRFWKFRKSSSKMCSA